MSDRTQPPREPWVPLEYMGAVPATSEVRQRHAMEYIAMYLDRIEQHTQQLANVATINSQANVRFAMALERIAKALEAK